jgi:hypothetical protein
MHRLRGIASDVREEHTPEGVVFEARLPAAEAGRYARYRFEPELPEELGEVETERLESDDKLPVSDTAPPAEPAEPDDHSGADV